MQVKINTIFAAYFTSRASQTNLSTLCPQDLTTL